MAYDSPKAIHFDVFFGGKKMPSSHTEALRLRWSIANMVREFVPDMLNLTLMQRVTIHEILADFNRNWAKHGITAQLGLSTEQCGKDERHN